MQRSWMQINVGAIVFLCSHQWNKVHVILGLLTMHRLPSQPLATLFIDILIERSGKQRGFIWCACCALSVCTCSTWRAVCVHCDVCAESDYWSARHLLYLHPNSSPSTWLSHLATAVKMLEIHSYSCCNGAVVTCYIKSSICDYSSKLYPWVRFL